MKGEIFTLLSFAIIFALCGYNAISFSNTSAIKQPKVVLDHLK